MSTEVLDSSRGAEWNDYVDRMPMKDIYYSCEYCRLFDVEGEQQAELFVYQQDDLLIVYPYLLRSIGHLPAISELGLMGDMYDISTPYGYGGPITNAPHGAEREELFRQFGITFAEYCRDRRILTEFVRFHPGLGNAADYKDVEAQLCRNTAFIDLRVGTEAGLIQHYCRNHKANIRKFQSSPFVVRRTRPEERIDTFIQLYYGTLDDLQAHSFYYFPRTFIEETCRLLEGRLELFEVMDGEVTVGACLVMHERPWMHYHLSGWNRDYQYWAPTKLLIHAAALWGMDNGFERFHLGGGYTGNDKLFTFKHGFATNQEPLDYHLGKRVFLPKLYERIRSSYANQVEDDYFPLYRHPTLEMSSIVGKERQA